MQKSYGDFKIIKRIISAYYKSLKSIILNILLILLISHYIFPDAIKSIIYSISALLSQLYFTKSVDVNG